MREIQTVQANQRQENGIVPFGNVFDARLIGILAKIVKVDVAGQIAAVTNERAAACAIAFPHFHITRAAETINESLENLFALRFALLRHHSVRSLRLGARNKTSSADNRA